MSKKPIKHESVDFRDIVWCVNNLPKADMDVIDGMEVPLTDIVSFFDEQISNGATFKFDIDDYSDMPSLKMMFLKTGFPNSTYAMSARGTDFEDCARILIYKFEAVAKGKLYELTETKSTGLRG